MPFSDVPAAYAPPRRRRWSLTSRFALISLCGLLGVGVGLIVGTSQELGARGVADGVRAAESAAALSRTVVPVEAYSTGLLATEDRDRLEGTVTLADDRLLELRLWTVDGAVLFDSAGSGGPQDEGTRPDVDRLDAAALRGLVDTEVIRPPDGSGADQHLEAYVPVTYAGEVVGAAQVLMDHSETAAAQDSAVRRLAVATGLGLLLLWLVLYRTVRTASQSLQRSAMDNARLALLDALTGLPNRRMLLDRLDRAVERSADQGTGVGLLLLDVDRFKDINDSLGHDRGDELLVQVAQRLLDTFRGRDLVARLGGDEFAVLLPGAACVADAESLAHRARAVFTEPYLLGGMKVHVATSIGVATIPDHAEDAGDLMRKADVAMYTAKQHRLGVAVYSASDDDSSPARIVLQAELHRAVTRSGELTMHYQPKVDLRTGDTVGLEALMRWHHPARGEVSPAVFIPLAEQSGLIDDLTVLALRSVLSQLAQWDPALRLPVAVNLSAHTAASPEIVSTISRLLAEHEVPAHLLEVEITETALVTERDRVVPVLHQLTALGVRVAIDDFGIGTTSISQLRDLPVAVLKIDQVFVDDLRRPAERPASRSVVKAMVDLAHSFGMQVVAEGVEDEATATRLAALDVDQAQGFWFSAAMTSAPAAARRDRALT